MSENTGSAKKKLSATAIIIIVVAVIAVWAIGQYNKLVALDENVANQWGNVENVYQRRADLIPNLVNTVKGAAEFAKSTLESVINARAAATQTKIDASSLTEENLAAFQAAQGELGAALGRLIAVTENYPELKANENFQELQAQLEGTENRITVARRDFNEAVRPYNSKIRRFPTNLIANIFGFDKKAYFEAEEGAEQAPDVEFNF